MSFIEELPENYRWLLDEPGPKVITEAVKWLGLIEGAGSADNPWIIRWARYFGGWIASFYTKDSIPWCGLFVGYIVARSGKPKNAKMLSARSWDNWGHKREGAPMLGDILVFWRGRPDGTSGHVGFYVAEDDEAYHVLGGNQGDSVSITRISKNRLISARHYYRNQPKNVRRVFIKSSDNLSTNEA